MKMSLNQSLYLHKTMSGEKLKMKKEKPLKIVETNSIMYANYCVECNRRATFIYKGSSLCSECFWKEKNREKRRTRRPKNKERRKTRDK